MQRRVTRRTLLSTAFAAPSPRPNVLLLLADSWRGQAMPAEDPNLQAPNLARLMREGAVCTRAYTSYAVCCPARASLWTGLSPRDAGVTRNHSLLPLDRPTMSQAFRDAGYRTGYIGKWRLDGGENPGFVPPDRRRGFDYWAAFNVQHRQYGGVYFRDTAEPVPFRGFEPDEETDLALDFLRAGGRDPFFLCVSWVAPHAPYTPPDGFAPGPRTIRLRPNIPEPAAAAARADLAGYYGLCRAVDRNIGRLLAALGRSGAARDTIVVFTSDHGHMLHSHGHDAIDMPYEEAVRIPLVFRFPRRLGRRRVGAPFSIMDLAPTLLSLCGLPPLKDSDGVDLRPALAGGAPIRRDVIHAEGGAIEGVEWRMELRGSRKRVTDAGGDLTHEFDLAKDPYEVHNLHSERKASVGFTLTARREGATAAATATAPSTQATIA
ncbi:MAG: sulfatase-like hydrolase/transferase [Bryobacteraceae bacterium]